MHFLIGRQSKSVTSYNLHTTTQPRLSNKMATTWECDCDKCMHGGRTEPKKISCQTFISHENVRFEAGIRCGTHQPYVPQQGPSSSQFNDPGELSQVPEALLRPTHASES